MALLENLTYNDIVDYLVSGVVRYCYNIDNTNRLPVYVKSGVVYDKIFSQGKREGKNSHSALYNTGHFKLTVTGGNAYSVPRSAVQTLAQNYMRKVNDTLTDNITNQKIQSLYQAIICFCNDNIRILSASCPFWDNFSSFKNYTAPIFITKNPDQTICIDTSILIKASDMNGSLETFSTIMRKYVTPKVHTVQYSLQAYKSEYNSSKN